MAKSKSDTTVVDDKSYDSNAFIMSLKSKGIVIPPLRNRKVHRVTIKHVYKERHLIEYFLVKVRTLGVSFPNPIYKNVVLTNLLEVLWMKLQQ